MTTKEIQQLITYLSKSDLDEVNIETDELKLSIKRNSQKTVEKVVEQIAPTQAPATAATPVESAAQQTPPPPKEAPKENYIELRSPMIGTFYRSASPDKPAFVQPGDMITKGQTVCIIEAMKLFNEIESEFEGKVVKVLADDAAPVEYDQPLLLIEPV